MRSFPALGGPRAGLRDEEKVSLFHSDFHTRKSDLHKSRGGPGPRPIPPTAHRNDPLTQRPIQGLKEHNFRLESLWNLIIDASRSRKYSEAAIFRGKSREFSGFATRGLRVAEGSPPQQRTIILAVYLSCHRAQPVSTFFRRSGFTLRKITPTNINIRVMVYDFEPLIKMYVPPPSFQPFLYVRRIRVALKWIFRLSENLRVAHINLLISLKVILFI